MNKWTITIDGERKAEFTTREWWTACIDSLMVNRRRHGVTITNYFFNSQQLVEFAATCAGDAEIIDRCVYGETICNERMRAA